jgi:hypothetical protein
MADRMIATPMANPIMGLLADRLKKVQQFATNPYGYANPPAEMLLNLLGVPAVQQTMERMAYGEPLTTGAGMTTKPRAEAVEAAMTVAPVAGLLAKTTKGLPVGASIKDVSYRGSHTPPNANTYGATLDDLTKILPEDVYSQQGKQLYGIGDRLIDSEWRIAALKARGKPDAEIEVYRAVPKGVKEINDGDWVSTSKKYAKDHGENTLNGEYDIISKKVKAKTLSTEGYPYEYGYNEVPNFPRQEALDTAQRNATLPIENGGLGLPKDNTAINRAKAMGFDIETLHGSPNPNIEAFDPMMAGGNTGNAFDNNIFATSSPESAGGYALNWKHYRNTVKTSPEFKAITREENTLLSKIGDLIEAGDTKGVADIKTRLDELTQQKTGIYNDFMAGKLGSEGSTIYPLVARSEDFLPYEAEGANWMRANRPAIDAAEQTGYSGALIRNVKDNAGTNLGTIADVLATSDPSRFRSRFAAFDPMRRNEPDLLAGVLPLSLLMDEENKKNADQFIRGLLGQ